LIGRASAEGGTLAFGRFLSTNVERSPDEQRNEGNSNEAKESEYGQDGDT
jgi:hypothetical protein